MTLVDLAVLIAQAAPAPLATEPSEGTVLLELAKLLGTGGATTFALLAWQALRSERGQRREERDREKTVRADRQRELDDRLSRIGTTLARIDERTAFLIGRGNVTASEERDSARRRGRTPPAGVPKLPRKPTETGD